MARKSMLGDEVSLFHDCTRSEITKRQVRNTDENDLPPYGLRLDVFEFTGSFLSIVVNQPNEGISGLKRIHVPSLNCIVEMEKPLEIFARLNIKHGPNTELIVRERPMDSKKVCAGFDLAYVNLNEKRVEKAWIDIIFR